MRRGDDGVRVCFFVVVGVHIFFVLFCFPSKLELNAFVLTQVTAAVSRTPQRRCRARRSGGVAQEAAAEYASS